MSKRAAGDVDKGLKALVLAAGNAAEASRECGIPEATLKSWRASVHRERYEALRREFEQRLDRDLAEEMHQVAADRMRILAEIATQSKTALKNRDYDTLKALSAADKSYATTAGILTGNNRSLRDKPAQVVEHRYELSVVEQAIRALEEPAIEGTAVEIPLGPVSDGPVAPQKDTSRELPDPPESSRG